MALQVLYEIDGARHTPKRVLEDRLRLSNAPPSVARYTRRLVRGVIRHREDIDDTISAHAPAWPIAQMAMVDRNLLRVAIYEMTVDGKTPAKAAINEAVDLARIYGSQSSSRFVNGVLGAVLDAMPAQEAEEPEPADVSAASP